MLNPIKIAIIACNLCLLNSCLISEALTMPKSWDWGFKARPYMARGLPDGDGDPFDEMVDYTVEMAEGMVVLDVIPRIQAEHAPALS